MYQSRKDSLGSKQLFSLVGNFAHAEETIRNEDMDVGHRMNSAAKVATVVDEWIGGSAVDRREKDCWIGRTTHGFFLAPKCRALSLRRGPVVVGGEFSPDMGVAGRVEMGIV